MRVHEIARMQGTAASEQIDPGGRAFVGAPRSRAGLDGSGRGERRECQVLSTQIRRTGS